MPCGGCPPSSTSFRIAEIDELATGSEVGWFREAVAHPARDDSYWVARDYAAGVEKVSAAVHLIGRVVRHLPAVDAR